MVAIASVIEPGPLIAGAIPVLMALTNGARWGLQTALAGAVTVGAVVIGYDPSSSTIVLLQIALTYFVPFGLALIVGRTGSLRLPFQLAVLVAGLSVVAVHVILDDAPARWQQLSGEIVRGWVTRLHQMGFATNEEAFSVLVAGTNWGTLAIGCLLPVMGYLFLGCWWQSLAQAPGAFGKEFQQLRLGNVLGGLTVLVVAAAFLLYVFSISVPLISALMLVAIAALMIQGLAAAHRLRARRGFGRGWLIATYLLLLVPITSPLVMLLLAGWGVADNWRRAA